MNKTVFIICSLPDYDDSMSIFGVFETRRRAENALKRDGYKQRPNPEVWSKMVGSIKYYDVEIDEWKINNWDTGEGND